MACYANRGSAPLYRTSYGFYITLCNILIGKILRKVATLNWTTLLQPNNAYHRCTSVFCMYYFLSTLYIFHNSGIFQTLHTRFNIKTKKNHNGFPPGHPRTRPQRHPAHHRTTDGGNSPMKLPKTQTRLEGPNTPPTRHREQNTYKRNTMILLTNRQLKICKCIKK